MKKIFYICILTLSLGLSAQKENLDSLMNAYKYCKPTDTNKVELAIKLVLEYRSAGDSAHALFYAAKGMQDAANMNWQKGLAKVYSVTGITHYLYGNYPRALGYQLKSLSIHEKIHNEAGMAISYHNIGNIYLDKKDIKNALSNYYKSCDINIRLNNKSMLSNTYNNIGNTYKSIGDFSNSISYYTKSFVIRKELNDTKGLASSYINIGGLFVKLATMPDDSMKRFLGALQMDFKPQTRKVLLDSAYAMQEEAIKINKELNNKIALSFSYKTLGNIEEYRQRQALAISNFKIAYNYANVANDPVLKIDISKELYQLYKAGKNYHEALLWYETYTESNEALSSEENQKEFGRQEAKFEYEKQQALDEVMRLKERSAEETARQKQTLMLWFTLFVLVLVIIISVFIYQRLKISRYQNKVIEHQKKEVEEQKHLIEAKQKEIVDSINYAKKIQETLLANKEDINAFIPENFILFQPKDIVSGDFYWATQHNHRFYLAVCDSTGHGVPGAFMSLLNTGFLNEAIKEKEIEMPHEVFNYVRARLIESIGKEEQQDGMDGILLCFDKEADKVYYAAANNGPVLVRNNRFEILPKDKMPVGKGQKQNSFRLHSFTKQKGDHLYVYTDGYADQFGGPKGKKFKYKTLNELLLSVSGMPLDEQLQIIQQKFVDWKGDVEQVDDVCIIGIRI